MSLKSQIETVEAQTFFSLILNLIVFNFEFLILHDLNSNFCFYVPRLFYFKNRSVCNSLLSNESYKRVGKQKFTPCALLPELAMDLISTLTTVVSLICLSVSANHSPINKLRLPTGIEALSRSCRFRTNVSFESCRFTIMLLFVSCLFEIRLLVRSCLFKISDPLTSCLLN